MARRSEARITLIPSCSHLLIVNKLLSRQPHAGQEQTDIMSKGLRDSGGTAVPISKLFAWEGRRTCATRKGDVCVYYCSAYHKAVRVGGGG
jgi:hypothetical protein